MARAPLVGHTIRTAMPARRAALDGLASEIDALSQELAFVCDGVGTVTWADPRATKTLGLRPGLPLGSLAAGTDAGKVARFLTAAATRRTDAWELVLMADGSPILFSATGGPVADGILIVAVRIPPAYEAVQDQFSQTMNQLAAAHREAVRHEQELAAAHRELVEKAAELERMNRLVAETARVDPLTGLGNRLRLTEDLTALGGRAERYGHGYSLGLCDVDHFKAYNDRYGHLAGDAALRAVGRALAARVRRGDGVYRYGGEEFLLVFPEQAGAGAARAMEGVRSAVRELRIPHAGNPGIGFVTISGGIGTFRPGIDAGYEAVVRRADAALYRAKARGRDRVECEGG